MMNESNFLNNIFNQIKKEEPLQLSLRNESHLNLKHTKVLKQF